MAAVRALGPGAAAVVALCCNSFTIMSGPMIECGIQSWRALSRSRATSGRSASCPRGNVGFEFVAAGNKLAARVCILLLLMSYKQTRWLLEQPAQSCLGTMPCFEWLSARVQAASFNHL